MSNPYAPLEKGKAPVPFVTDYHKDIDDFVIEYAEIERVKMVGDKDTDFVITKKVEEVNRTKRQKLYDSYSNDVGILNIIEKVRMSGDITLLNQSGRVPGVIVGKDALGHDVEQVLDVTKYQVDQVEALESYKVGAKAFESLDPDLKKKMTLEQVAKMSDKEIDDFLISRMPKKEIKQDVKEGDNK